MADRKLKLGIAGLGRGFTVMLPTLSLHPNLNAVAAVDTRAKARSRFEADFGGTSYDSVEAMCAEADIDAVYVTTPHQFHAEHAEIAARAGKHVLVEKPMAITLDDCTRMIEAAKTAGVRVVGIMPVGLFGQAADMTTITHFADSHGLWVLDDAAQSIGAWRGGKTVGEMANMTATSFFPAKPLGCYGDGGAVFTDDDDLAEIARSARIHGMGKNRYQYDRIGMTARMDTMQAAVLLEKLTLFPDELRQRQLIAGRYNHALTGLVTPQKLDAEATSSWAQYCVLLPEHTDRNAVQTTLKQQGIPTAIYYTQGIHQHPPYAKYPIETGGLTVTAELCERILALPFHAWLDEATQDYIINGVMVALGE